MKVGNTWECYNILFWTFGEYEKTTMTYIRMIDNNNKSCLILIDLYNTVRDACTIKNTSTILSKCFVLFLVLLNVMQYTCTQKKMSWYQVLHVETHVYLFFFYNNMDALTTLVLSRRLRFRNPHDFYFLGTTSIIHGLCSTCFLT